MDAERNGVRLRCTRFLTYHPASHRDPREMLRLLADMTPPGLLPDQYGEGPPVAELEAEIASILGKEAAAFFPSGTMAQQTALRIWSERRGKKGVAFHPTCHLELHEQKGYAVLHGLRGVLVGSADRLLTLADLEKVAEPLAALLIELPQREIGGLLPSWDELVATRRWAEARGVALHLDGARLWESQPFYGRPYPEITALFDSVYVSLYKTLGAIAGAVLAGTADFVAEACVWRKRHGGTLVHAYPYTLAARRALHERLPRMEAYVGRAKEIARVLGALGLTIVPDPPHTNLMHAFLRGDRKRIDDAVLAFARAERFWLFGPVQSTPLPDVHRVEIVIGDGALELDDEVIRSALSAVLTEANR